jgi:type II secretory pathway component PulF
VPVIGNLVAQFAMARFCRMLGTLLGAGVPLINSLNVARRSIGNQILVDTVANSIDLVREGKPLGTSLAECRTLFPGSVLEMISVAEESGKLDAELVRLATVTEGDLDRQGEERGEDAEHHLGAVQVRVRSAVHAVNRYFPTALPRDR